MDRLLPAPLVPLAMIAVALTLGALVLTSSAKAVAPQAPPGCGTATTTSHENTTPTGIPAGPAVVSSTLEVSGAGAHLTDLDLVTNLTHTFAADLDITLQSPAGTVATITTDNGAGNDNVFNGTTFDDQANPAGQVPYVTNNGVASDHPYVNLQTATPLAPEEALAVFNGEDPNGTWTLTISDDLAGDSGTLESWRLDVQSLSGAPEASATSHASAGAVGIPAGPAVVTSTIDVTGAEAHLTDVNLLTNLTHTFAADLDITLQSPAGTLATITTDNGAGNDNVFNGTTFDDQANPAGQVPYVSNGGVVTDHPYANLQTATPLEPEEALAVFNGENPNGTWTLTISDDLAGDGGEVSWSLDLTTGACPAPPEPPADPPATAPAQAPATAGEPAPQPSGGSTLKVKADRLSVFAPAAGARCLGAEGACNVRVMAGRRVIARGTANGKNVPLHLTRSGRKMLTHRFGGVRAKVVATDTARRARARTQAILPVERITTPRGSWVPDRAELTAVGRRFVRSLQKRMVGVTSLRCDGHVARPEGAPRPEFAMALSRARAAVVCGKEAKLVAHGNKNPIASNANEKGRAKNRRVEVAVRHNEAKR
jgi:subtilisin-like proprotein convertase family protein